jgi:hypothetical protein
MSVTGHKAESSLKTYSERTDENTKKLMSQTISEKITGEKITGGSDADTAFGLQPFSNFQGCGSMEDLNPDFKLLPLSNSQEDTLMRDLFDESDGVDDTLRSIPLEQNVQVQTTAVNNIMVQPASVRSAINFPMPYLNHCTSVTINYNVM